MATAAVPAGPPPPYPSATASSDGWDRSHRKPLANHGPPASRRQRQSGVVDPEEQLRSGDLESVKTFSRTIPISSTIKPKGQQVGMWPGQLCFPAEIVRLGEFAVEQAREDADDRIEERGREEFLQGVLLVALVLPPVPAGLPR